MKEYQAILFTTTDDRYSRHRPLGAYALATVLRNKGLNVLVVDMIQNFSLDEITQILTKSVNEKTIFVGWSGTFFLSRYLKQFFPKSENFFVEINKRIKKINSNTKILFGGASSYQFLEGVRLTKKTFGIEYVVHGYSEGMICDIVDAFQKNMQPKFSNKIEGIYEINYDYKGELFNFRESYHTWIDDDIPMYNECLPLEVARGCIFHCKFCAYPLLGKDGKDLSYLKREENLLKEVLENYEKNKILTYFIVDDTFNERTEKIEMMIRIRDQSKLDLNFVGYNRLDLMAAKPEQISLLKEMNFTGHFFGIESLNHESAKSIGKGMHPDRLIDTMYKIKSIYNNRVSFFGGFIVGLPKESPETLMNWVSKITHKDSPMDAFDFAPLLLNRRTTHTMSEFEKNPERYGYEILDNLNWKNEFWDKITCEKIAEDINKSLLKSGRQKISCYQASGLVKLNYDYFKYINIPQNRLSKLETSVRFQKYIMAYKAKVMQHLNIPKKENSENPIDI